MLRDQELTFVLDSRKISAPMAIGVLLLASLAVTAATEAAFPATEVKLVTFDGSVTWEHTDDPVMGGESKSTFSQKGVIGTFNGTCKIVPSLKAPGFCKIATSSGRYPDASRYVNGSLILAVRSSTPDFAGFKVAIDAAGLKCPGIPFSPFTTSWKAPFKVPAQKTFALVKVPLHRFSCDWSSYTGSCETKDPGIFGKQHHCCSDSHPEKCPSVHALSAITGVEVWAEGAAGDFHLEMQYIAVGA